MRALALQSKLTVYAAIGGVLAMMGGIVMYAAQDNPQLELVEVELGEVAVSVGQDGNLRLEPAFLVSNPSETTFTVSLISYRLMADGQQVAAGQYSTADIAMPGRAVFYPGAQIPLTSSVVVEHDELGSIVYERLVAGQVLFSAEGTVTAESAWSIVEKDFRT